MYVCIYIMLINSNSDNQLAREHIILSVLSYIDAN